MKRKPKRRYPKRAKPVPDLWRIDDPSGVSVYEFELNGGQRISLRLSSVHAAFLGWMQEAQNFNVEGFLSDLWQDHPSEIEKATQAAILRLYLHREAHGLPRPVWLASLA